MRKIYFIYLFHRSKSITSNIQCRLWSDTFLLVRINQI